MKDKIPCKFRLFDEFDEVLKVKAESSCDPEFTGIRIV